MEDAQSLAIEATDEETVSKTRLIFSGVLGSIAAFFSVGALSKSTEWFAKSFYQGKGMEDWSLVTFGDHIFLRMFVTLGASLIGGLVAGLAVQKDDRRIAAIVSSVPTFGFVGIVVYLGATSAQFLVNMRNNSAWAVLLCMVLCSIPLARFGESLGLGFRREHPDWFGIPGRPMAMHWSTYIWFVPILYFMVADFWFGCLLTGAFSVRSFFEFRFLHGLGSTLLFIASSIQFIAMRQIFRLLMAGKIDGLSTGKIFLRTTGYILVTPLLLGVLRAIGVGLNGVHENLPSWVYWLFGP